MLDFDEILVNVNNPQIKKYLAESIKSYAVGNYRSAIISVWVAAMFDLVKKFEILVEQREPTALKVWKTLKPKIEDHKNWEQELITNAKSVGMLSVYEAGTLERLHETRNRYAHPSFDDVGTLFDPTPEEVRYFIRTLYDVVLSQPAQLGVFYVNQLIASLKEANYFYSKPSTSFETNRDEVLQKLRLINLRQIPRLIKQLFVDLDSPDNESHKTNILCFIINSWDYGSKQLESRELLEQITSSWDTYLSDNSEKLNQEILEAILCYPECFNLLSDRTHNLIKVIIHNLLSKSSSQRDWTSSSLIFAKFLSYSDVIPLAAALLNEAPEMVPIDQLIKQHYLYLEELGKDRFSNTFGIAIFEETRKALKTRNGYAVNPVLNVLRSCDMWSIADSRTAEDQNKFATELITSLCSNNFATMNLLRFDNQNEIPERWAETLLSVWTDKLVVDTAIQQCLSFYINQYLGLLHNHNTHKGISYSRSKEGIKILDRFINIDVLKEVKEDSPEAWNFLLTILKENQDVISSEDLKNILTHTV